jgi:prolyl-tRNA editing enzyme YbaK/EbsC (Cys-tRNA(Pro) deacylase)
VYIDPGVLEVDVVYCGGGDVDALVEVPTEELARITRAVPVDLALQ